MRWGIRNVWKIFLMKNLVKKKKNCECFFFFRVGSWMGPTVRGDIARNIDKSQEVWVYIPRFLYLNTSDRVTVYILYLQFFFLFFFFFSSIASSLSVEDDGSWVPGSWCLGGRLANWQTYFCPSGRKQASHFKIKPIVPIVWRIFQQSEPNLTDGLRSLLGTLAS